MICLLGNRPVLQIGHHQITGYDTAWLRQSLIRGAEAAQREDFPFIDDLMKGIRHYLEHKCSLRLLTIEDLYDRMRLMLERIGCGAIAKSLPLLAPPITISLERVAQEVGSGFELAFFNRIHDDIEDLRRHGVEELRFTHTRDCVKILRGTNHWNKQCEQLYKEIFSFLHSHGHPNQPNTKEIQLILASS